MKSFILAAALMLAAFTSKSFAADIRVSPKVLHTFMATFGKASEVQWTSVDQLYRADFTVDGEKVIAFFNTADGNLVATSRYITVNELPRIAKNSLKTVVTSATITEVFEIQSNESLDFYATIRTGDKTSVLKWNSIKWEVYKK